MEVGSYKVKSAREGKENIIKMKCGIYNKRETSVRQLIDESDKLHRISNRQTQTRPDLENI